MMLVDLARNDIARVAEPGSRIVTELLTVEKYESVQHLVSNVKGKLADDLDALERVSCDDEYGDTDRCAEN